LAHALCPEVAGLQASPRGEAWHASLALSYRASDGRTTLARAHRGPLQVQKALYPEGPRVCHSIVVHPPGGIAGGDALDIDVAVDPGAHALITTPGATRWYKANGRTARQQVRLCVAGTLEWLPQETIVFDAAHIESAIDIDAARGAATLGWDIVALGRAAAGETFADGVFAQSIRLRDGGVLCWHERTRITGGDALLASPVGLDGCHVFGCLWALAAGPIWDDERMDALRAELGGPADDTPGGSAVGGRREPRAGAALTRLTPRLLVARVLAGSTRLARAQMEAAWAALRPHVVGLPARAPRLWAL
jgi:urease accessory protein